MSKEEKKLAIERKIAETKEAIMQVETARLQPLRRTLASLYRELGKSQSCLKY